jgi:hypothetical protein
MRLAGGSPALLLATVLAIVLAAGCSVPALRRVDPMTPLEQLLTSEAIARGLQDRSLVLEEQTAGVYLETAGFTKDQIFMQEVVRGFLGRQGFEVRESLEEASYRIQLVIQSLGTKQSIRLFGLPASNAALLPISTPEMALYKRNREDGYARFYFDIFDVDGHYIRSTPDYEGAAYRTKYTILFVITWTRSDLPDALLVE